MRIETLLSLALFCVGCDAPKPQPKPEPVAPKPARKAEPSYPKPSKNDSSCPAMKFEPSNLPIAFSVARRGHLGVVTVDEKHEVVFEPSPDADAKNVAKLRAELDRQLGAGRAMYRYMGNGDDPGDYIMCRGEVVKGDPSYPEALKFALSSHRFKVD